MRLTKPQLLVLVLCILLLGSCTSTKDETTNLTVGEKIAKAHGIDQFPEINKMTYRFNVQRDTLLFGRDWQWWPKTGEVVYSRGADTVRFNQFQVESDDIKKTDQSFINDKYWLLFPFQLVWDADVSYIEKEDTSAPISGIKMHHVIVAYTQNGGYTPGDVYELFCDDNWIIQEWVFRRGGQEEPTIICTWEGYEDFNGVKIATEHRNEDGSFRLFFSGLAVE